MKNSFNKVLSFMLALVMIVGCFSVITVSAADECNHNPETDKVVKEVKATCAQSGYTTYECATCGKGYTKYTAKSSTHTGLVEVTGIDATCTAPAYGAGVYCKDCTANEDGTPNWALVAEKVAAGDKALVVAKAVEDSKPLGHDFVYFESFSDNCEVRSYSYFSCSRCKKTPAQVITAEELDEGEAAALNAKYPLNIVREKKNHNYTKAEVVVELGTCTDGVTKLTCKACKATTTVTTPAPHKLKDLKVGNCGEYKAGKYCETCNKQFGAELNDNKQHVGATKQTALTDALIKAGYTTPESLKKDATCTEAGMEVWSCPTCKAIWEKTVEATNHVGTTVVTTVTFDYDEDVYCSGEVAVVTYCTAEDCTTFRPGTKEDGTYLKKEVVVEAVAHTFADMSTDLNTIACGAIVETWKQCTNPLCGDKVDVKATGTKAHVWGDWTETTGNCVDGFVHSRYCTNVVATNPADPYNDDGTVKDPVACDSDDQVDVVVKAGIEGAHDKTSANSLLVPGVIPATCTSKSATALICSACQEYATDIVYSDVDDKNANNHVQIVLKRSTTNGTGTALSYVGKTGTPVVIGVTKWPTCNEAGSANILCDCGATVKVAIQADGHAYEENVCLRLSGAVGTANAAAFLANSVNWNSKGWNKWDASKQTWVACKEADTSGTWHDAMAKAVSCKASGWTVGTICTRCGDVKVARKEIPVTAEVLANKASHAKINESTKKVVPATCITGGYTSYYCSDCCKTADARIKVEVTDINENFHDTVDGEIVKAVAAVAATCKDAGNYAYNTCTVCKQIWNVATCDNTCTGWTEGKIYSEDCTVAAHQIAHVNNLPAIAKLEHDFTDNGEEADCVMDANRQYVRGSNLVEALDPTCTTPGYTAFAFCNECGAKSDTYSVVKAKGHTMVDFKEVKPTCTTDGIVLAAGKTKADLNDGQYCSECLTDGRETPVVVVVEKPAFHTIGVNELTSEDYDPTKDVDNIPDCFTEVHAEITSGAAADCTAPEVTGAYECSICNEVRFTTISYKKASHTWSNVENVFSVGDGKNSTVEGVIYFKPANGEKKVFNAENFADMFLLDDYKAYKNEDMIYACEVSFENFVKCINPNCEVTHKNGNKTAKADHYYVNADTKENVVIDVDCTKIEAHLDQQCVLCGRTVVEKVPTGADKNDYLVKNHTNVVKDEKKATCDEAGYSVTICLDCHEEIVPAVETPAFGSHKVVIDAANNVVYSVECTEDHEHKLADSVCEDYYLYDGKYYKNQFDISKKVEPTKTAAGAYTYYCTVCKKSIEVEIPALAGMDLEFVPVYEASDLVRVDVLASATKIKFNKISFVFGTNNKGIVLSNKRATINSAAFNAADNVTLKQTKLADYALSVEILVPANIQGKQINTTFTGDKVVIASLYFDVLYTATPDAEFMFYILGDGANAAEIYNVAEGTTLAEATTAFAFDTKNANYNVVTEALAKFETMVIGDINGNGEIDATDVAQTATVGYTGEYVVALDFNKDGVVDIADYVAVAVFAASEGTYADYLELIGIDYLAIVNAVDSDLMVDLNGDEKIDEADRTYLAKRVLQKLQSISAYDKASMLTVEEIIDLYI